AGGEQVLPAELPAGAGELPGQGERQRGVGLARGPVLLVPESALSQVAVEVRLQRAGQHEDAVLALAVADGELMPGEVEGVDAELAAPRPAQAGAGEGGG